MFYFATITKRIRKRKRHVPKTGKQPSASTCKKKNTKSQFGFINNLKISLLPRASEKIFNCCPTHSNNSFTKQNSTLQKLRYSSSNSYYSTDTWTLPASLLEQIWGSLNRAKNKKLKNKKMNQIKQSVENFFIKLFHKKFFKSLRRSLAL